MNTVMAVELGDTRRMGFYENQVVPRFTDLVMSRRELTPIRARVAASLDGDVLEHRTPTHHRPYFLGVKGEAGKRTGAVDRSLSLTPNAMKANERSAERRNGTRRSIETVPRSRGGSYNILMKGVPERSDSGSVGRVAGSAVLRDPAVVQIVGEACLNGRLEAWCEVGVGLV
jgi:hypothetical protein